MREPIPKRTKHFCSFGPYRLYLAERELFRGADPVALTPKALDTLLLLIGKHGHVVEKDELMSALWPDTFVEEANLVVQVSQLRKVLGARPDAGAYIETVPKRGYRFAAPVTDSWEEQSAPAPVMPPRGGGTKRKLLLGLTAVALLIVVSGIATWFFLSANPGPVEPVSAVPLTTLPGMEWNPSLSPDGATVAFTWKAQGRDNYDAYLKVVGTDSVIPLAAGPLLEGGCSWSLDGRWIAFARINFSGTVEYLRKTVIGGPEEKLAELLGPLSENETHSLLGSWTAWSPDGRWLVVMGKQHRDEPYALFALSIASRKLHKLTTPPAGAIGDAGPAFSPDGRRLVFHRVHGLGSSDVFILSVSDDLLPIGEPEPVPSSNPHNFTPAWTSDGRELVFSSASSSRYFPALVRVPVSGSGEMRTITGSGDNAWFPTISRQGRRLVYSQLSFFGDVWTAELQAPGGPAGPPTHLISSTRLDLQPAYSPDGGRIAFVSVRSGTREIWLCDSDGKNPKPLTALGGSHVYAPAWSPDGTQVAFASDQEGDYDLYVVPASGGEPQRLTFDAADDTAPRWSRDGKSLFFTSNRSGRFEVWKMQLAGGAVTQVTRQGGGGAHLLADRGLLYYAKSSTGPTEIWRVPADGGEEVPVLGPSLAVMEYSVGRHGIYFTTAPDAQLGSRLRFYDFATETTKDVLFLSSASTTVTCGCEHWVGQGMTVSPDEKTVLFGKLDHIDSDLMLVENFR